MKLDDTLECVEEIVEMLTVTRDSLTDVLVQETSLLELSKEKLKGCLLNIEKIIGILRNDSPYENFVKPLHQGLSRSMDCLDGTVSESGGSLSGSRSTSNLAENFDMHNTNEDEIYNLNGLKENYLQVVRDLTDSHEINGDDKTEANNFKPESSDAKSEVNDTKPEIVRHRKSETESQKRRRKRDSSTLFDISLDDLTEPDHSGMLTEKHSGNEWWCVLQDQHLCMFPSQNPQELAYDVLLVPCCEISLDDAYNESPVFRLTQVGSTPWVFSAGIERNLRAWIRALYRACGRDDVDSCMRSAGSRKNRKSEKKQKRDMKIFSNTIEEMEEEEEEAEDKLEDDGSGTKEISTEISNNKCPEMEKKENNEEKTKLSTAHCHSVNGEMAEDKIISHKDQITQNSSPDERQNTAPNSPTSYNETETVESINSPKLRLENSNKKTTVALPLSPVENTNNMKINLPLRKATKRRVKVLRWLKKAFLGEETQNVAVIGDIYKLEAPNNNRVKLWCMVRNRVLYCYRNIMNETIDMEIPLDSCRAFAETNSPGGSYAFSIHKGDEKLCTFVANTARERERWMEIVRNRRGTVFLGEFCEDCENGENGESDQSSGTEAEDITEDEGGYVVMERNTSVESSDSESDYAEPYDEAVCNTLTCEECGNDDSGYVSVIALEYEVKRRRSSKESKFNPNVTSKSDLRNLTKKDNPIQTNFLSAAALAKTQPRNKERSPAPLPRIVTNQKIMSRQNDRVDGIGGLEIDTKPKEKITEEIAAEEKMESNLGSEAVVYDDSVAQQSTVTATGNQNPGGLLVESHMTATSSLKDSPANQGKFGQRGGAGMTGCWRPEVNDKSQYLEIDLEKITCVGAIGIQGRPNYDENGGEFVKSYTLHYSTDRDKWMPYKRSGKTKVFRGNSSPNQEKKKILKHVISARYFRVYSESWHNHIALRVGLYRPQQGKEKKCEKSGELSPTKTGPLERKKVILRKEISGPGSAPLTENITPKHDQTFLDSSTDVTNTTKETSGTSTIGTQSLEGRVKLRETLLVKEKKEQIVVLENLKKQMNYAKDKMIVVNNSNQTKSEAIDTKEEYLTINLEVVKVKKRLQEIETELRDLRLFISHQREQQQQHERPKILSKPARPPMIRRPSKEIKVCTTAVSPVVDREAFNPPAAEPPVRKVMDNVKMFENLQGR